MSKENSQRGSSKIVSIIVTVVIMLVVSAVIKQCFRQSMMTDLKKSVQKDLDEGKLKVVTAKWERYPLYGTDMALTLPGKPEEVPMPLSGLPPEIQAKTVTMKAYHYTENDLIMFASYFQYTNDVTASPEGGLRASLEDMKKQKPNGNLNYQIDNRDPENVTVSGSIDWIEKTPFDIKGFARGRGEKGWILFVISKRESAESKASSERILKSVTF